MNNNIEIKYLSSIARAYAITACSMDICMTLLLAVLEIELVLHE